jgi:hypothetical protein
MLGHTQQYPAGTWPCWLAPVGTAIAARSQHVQQPTRRYNRSPFTHQEAGDGALSPPSGWLHAPTQALELLAFCVKPWGSSGAAERTAALKLAAPQQRVKDIAARHALATLWCLLC